MEENWDQVFIDDYRRRLGLDENGRAYYRGVMKAAETSDNKKVRAMADTALESARNFQKMMKLVRFRPYLIHKRYIVDAIRLIPKATTGDVFDVYSLISLIHDEEPRTYRRMTQLLKELLEEGKVKATMENRGKHGRTRTWELGE